MWTTIAIASKILLLLVARGVCEVNAENDCTSQLLERCTCDGDCCNRHTNPSITCEIRNKALGHRCYIGHSIGEECTQNMECTSQICSDKKCVPNQHGVERVRVSSCMLDLAVTHIVNGALPSILDTTCPACPSPPTVALGDVHQQLDEANPTRTTLSNNYALGSGLELIATVKGRVRTMKICSGDGSHMRDPASFKLEGECTEEGCSTIQEGALSFPLRAGTSGAQPIECIDVAIKASSLFLRYKITFPTQVGGDEECVLDGTCQNYPTEISGLAFHGPCKQATWF